MLVAPELELLADPLPALTLPDRELVVLPLVGVAEVVPLAGSEVAPAEDAPLLVPEAGVTSLDPLWGSALWPDPDEVAAELRG